MAPAQRIVFALGARLGMSAAAVERLSAREIADWVRYFQQGARSSANDDAIDMETLTQDQLRAMFPQ